MRDPVIRSRPGASYDLTRVAALHSFLTGTNEPPHDKTNKNACVPSEDMNQPGRSKDSDQPGHPLSLIRVFTVRMKKPLVLRYPSSAQRRL